MVVDLQQRNWSVINTLIVAQEQGIFRISANANNVAKILEKVMQNSDFQFQYCEFQQPHDVAGAFKQYFRRSWAPVFPYEIYPLLLASFCDSVVDLEAVKAALRLVRPTTRRILGIIFTFLFSIQLLEEQNLMNTANLGIVFGPTLIRDPGESVELSGMHFCPLIVSALIIAHTEVFSVRE
jgi:hypothetical protein